MERDAVAAGGTSGILGARVANRGTQERGYGFICVKL